MNLWHDEDLIATRAKAREDAFAEAVAELEAMEESLRRQERTSEANGVQMAKRRLQLGSANRKGG